MTVIMVQATPVKMSVTAFNCYQRMFMVQKLLIKVVNSQKDLKKKKKHKTGANKKGPLTYEARLLGNQECIWIKTSCSVGLKMHYCCLLHT